MGRPLEISCSGTGQIGISASLTTGSTFISTTLNQLVQFTFFQGAGVPLTNTITLANDLASGVLTFYGYFQSFVQLITDQGFILQARFTLNGAFFPTVVYWLDSYGNPFPNPAVALGPMNMIAGFTNLSAGDIIGVNLRLNGNLIGYTSTVGLPFTISIPQAQLNIIGS